MTVIFGASLSEPHTSMTALRTCVCRPHTGNFKSVDSNISQWMSTPTVIFGASLSEPHTSVTALRTRVCILICLDRPHTGNFKSAVQIFHNECPHRRVFQLLELSRENKREGLLPDCKVSMKERDQKAMGARTAPFWTLIRVWRWQYFSKQTMVTVSR